MAQRFIKDTIWTSPNLNQLSDLAERHFYRLLPLPDDHGCCELTPAVIKGRCYPLKSKITTQLIQKWTEELEQADIVRTWTDSGRIYGWFVTWAKQQRVRSLNKRKTPEPPHDIVTRRQLTSIENNCGSIFSLLSSFSSPLSSLSRKRDEGGFFSEEFEKFWKAYPKKVSKGQAERTWQKLHPTEQLLGKILVALERAKTSEQWTKDNGRFIPHASTWLNAKGWEDELVAPEEDPIKSWAEQKKRELEAKNANR